MVMLEKDATPIFKQSIVVAVAQVTDTGLLSWKSQVLILQQAASLLR